MQPGKKKALEPSFFWNPRNAKKNTKKRAAGPRHVPPRSLVATHSAHVARSVCGARGRGLRRGGGFELRGGGRGALQRTRAGGVGGGGVGVGRGLWGGVCGDLGGLWGFPGGGGGRVWLCDPALWVCGFGGGGGDAVDGRGRAPFRTDFDTLEAFRVHPQTPTNASVFSVPWFQSGASG